MAYDPDSLSVFAPFVPSRVSGMPSTSFHHQADEAAVAIWYALGSGTSHGGDVLVITPQAVVEGSTPTLPEPGEAVVVAQSSGGLGQTSRGTSVEPLAVPAPVEGRARAAVAPGAAENSSANEDDDGYPWWLGLGLLALGGGGGGGVGDEATKVVSLTALKFGSEGADGQPLAGELSATSTGFELYQGRDEGNPLIDFSAKSQDLKSSVDFKLTYVGGVAELSVVVFLNGVMVYDGGKTETITTSSGFKDFLNQFSTDSGSTDISFDPAKGTLTVGEFVVRFPSLDNSAANGNIINSMEVSYLGGGTWGFFSEGEGKTFEPNPDMLVGRDFFESGTAVTLFDPAYLEIDGWSGAYALLLGDVAPSTFGAMDVDDIAENGVQVYAINDLGGIAQITLTGYEYNQTFDLGRLFEGGKYQLFQAVV